MRSRSRCFALLTLSLAATAGLMTGCAKKQPQAEIRLPAPALGDTAWAEAQATEELDTAQTQLDTTTGELKNTADSTLTPTNYGQGQWGPQNNVPDGGTLFNPADVIAEEVDGFGTGNEGDLAATDAATGDFLNSEPADGVEDGIFTAELEMVHFPFDSDQITPEYATILQNHANWLGQNTSVMVQVEGHTDERGTEEYNISLGQRRADAVRGFLIENGVMADRLSTISYGKMRPLTFEQTEDAHAMNRRAMFLVYEVEGAGGQEVAAGF